MRPIAIETYELTIKGVTYYQVVYPKVGDNGKWFRARKTFRKKGEAETFASQAKLDKENDGVASLSIPVALRLEAVKCNDLLAAHGKTLTQAVEHYLAYLEASAKSRKVKDVVADLLKFKATEGASDRYLGDLRARLNRFSATFGEKLISDVTKQDVGAWEQSLGVLAPETKKSFRRRLSVLFEHAIVLGAAHENPVHKLSKIKGRDSEVGVLSVEQTAKLLESASEETLPYWAIGAFAGLRAAEVEKLEWKHVKFSTGRIVVPPEIAKTRSRRVVTMPENLRRWLAPYRNREGSDHVCPQSALRDKLEADREKAGLLEDWPDNALRHGYGSYMLPIMNDVAKLALEMGNSPNMIFKHYREVVEPEDAEAYWRISPAAQADNVVRMVAA